MSTSTPSHLTPEQIDSLAVLIQSVREGKFPPEEAAEILEEAESILNLAGYAELWNKPPHPRQADFLNLRCRDILYGGAAGSGKSWALLMWLGQGVHIPGYLGIIFRRTLQDLKKGDGIVGKSHELYLPLGGKYNGSDHFWTFPSGAKIYLEGLEHENSVHKFQGSSYHRIAFDELTTFTERQYIYFSHRLRSIEGFPIPTGRCNSANPGGEGHEWVMKRYITREAIDTMRGWHYTEPTPRGLIFWKGDCAFVPARLADNPTMRFDEYVDNMRQMAEVDPVMLQRMLNGDWEIREDGLIRPEWLKSWHYRGDYINLSNGQYFDQRGCPKFITVDPAGTSEDRVKESRGKNKPFTAIQVWIKPPASLGKKLVLLHAVQKHYEFVEIVAALRRLHKEWGPQSIRIENEKMGNDLVSLLRNELPVSTISTQNKDKKSRATKLLYMLEQGQVFLPSTNDTWLINLKSEWLGWTGHPDQVCDQIDAAAYAAIIANNEAGNSTAVDFDFTQGTGAFARF